MFQGTKVPLMELLIPGMKVLTCENFSYHCYYFYVTIRINSKLMLIVQHHFVCRIKTL